MTEVYRYLGCPGSGKSKSLLDIIEDEAINNHLKIGDFLFISFTRSQISNIKSRIGKIYPLANIKDINNSIKTIHGAALSILLQSNLMPNAQIITETKDHVQHYIDFCRANNLAYEIQYENDEMASDPDYSKTLPNGNAFFKINDYLATCLIPYDQWKEVAYKLHFTDAQIKNFTQDLFYKWDQFKLSNNLLQHDDYIQINIFKNLLPSHRRILMLDEAQDVSPLQVKLYEMWRDANVFDKIYIAGDEFQSIYGFRGATPTFIVTENCIDLGATETKKVKSYRCPNKIIDIANSMLEVESHAEPSYMGGKVEVLYPNKNDDMTFKILDLYKTYGKVMILSRIKAGCITIHNALNYAGIPHTSLSNRFTTWDHAWVLKNKQRSKFDMQSFMTNAYINPNKAIKDLYNMTFAYSDEFLHKIIFKAIKQNYKINPKDIIIDTIHASKGLECPCVVILDTGFNDDENIDEERRIFYVGTTRSSDYLGLMLSPKAKKFCNVIDEALMR